MSQDEFDDLFGSDSGGEEEISTTINNTEKKSSKKSISDLNVKELVVGERQVIGGGARPMLLKLPGFIKVCPEKYDALKIKEELENGQTDALQAVSTIRWNNKAQCNARIVEWEDGSLSLQVGKELFDISTPSIDGELNYAYTHQKSSQNQHQLLEATCKIRERLIIKPFQTPRIYTDSPTNYSNSYTRHTKNSKIISNNKSESKIKLAVTTDDPEAQKQRMIKMEQEKLKEKRKAEAKKARVKDLGRASGVLSARFLEEGMDEADGEEEIDEYEKDFIDDEEHSIQSEEEEVKEILDKSRKETERSQSRERTKESKRFKSAHVVLSEDDEEEEESNLNEQGKRLIIESD